MDYENILYETVDRITAITINRPKSLNTLTYKTLDELRDAFTRAQTDSETKVILITGAGRKAFIAGMDISELSLCEPVSGKEVAQRGQALFGFLEQLGKPTIAVVNGFALGAGTEIALACTMRVASPNARFGLPEVGLGILPGYGGSQRLPRLVGKGRAMEIILSAEAIDAEEAYRIGLVNKVFPEETLQEEARKFAQRFAKKGGVALRLAMEAIHQGMDLPLERGLELEASLAGLTWATEDSKEGMRAFLEKRKPVFRDR
jgi:enoyl-CoA hydratase